MVIGAKVIKHEQEATPRKLLIRGIHEWNEYTLEWEGSKAM